MIADQSAGTEHVNLVDIVASNHHVGHPGVNEIIFNGCVFQYQILTHHEPDRFGHADFNPIPDLRFRMDHNPKAAMGDFKIHPNRHRPRQFYPQ